MKFISVSTHEFVKFYNNSDSFMCLSFADLVLYKLNLRLPIGEEFAIRINAVQSFSHLISEIFPSNNVTEYHHKSIGTIARMSHSYFGNTLDAEFFRDNTSINIRRRFVWTLAARPDRTIVVALP